MQGHGSEVRSPCPQPALRRPGLRGDQAQSHHGHRVGERCPARRGEGWGWSVSADPTAAAKRCKPGARCAPACAPGASRRMLWARSCLVPHVEADFCGLSAGGEGGAGMGFRSRALRRVGVACGSGRPGRCAPRDGNAGLCAVWAQPGSQRPGSLQAALPSPCPRPGAQHAGSALPDGGLGAYSTGGLGRFGF